MDIIISNDKTLGDIKAAFQSKFPHLKLEFYDHKHQEGEGTPQRYLLDDTLKVAEARKKKTEGELSIHGNQKTNTLEMRFQELYGLNVQVFRKSGKLWLQTTATDDWTLAHQESMAAERDAVLRGEEE